MGARNRVGIELSDRPASLRRLAEFIPGLHKRLKIRAQDCGDFGIGSQTLYNHLARSHPQLALDLGLEFQADETGAMEPKKTTAKKNGRFQTIPFTMYCPLILNYLKNPVSRNAVEKLYSIIFFRKVSLKQYKNII
jgi:hypothetical protein